jgi:kumamolisin
MRTLKGSEPHHAADVSLLHKKLSQDPIEVLVTLRPQRSLPSLARLAKGTQPSRAPVDHGKHYGAHPDEIAHVEKFARRYNLQVVKINPVQRTVRVRGAPQDLAAAFKVDLGLYQKGHTSYLSHTKPISLPDKLADAVTAVFDLDKRPLKGLQHEFWPTPRHLKSGTSYTVPELARLYDFPSDGGAGKGQCVGMIQLDGGYEQSDIDKYFKVLNIKKPEIVTLNPNKLSQDLVANYQVTQNIQVVGSLVPEAKLVVYNANANPSTLADYYELFAAAITDETNRPTVITNSWFFPEDIPSLGIARDQIACFERLFMEAASRGITLCSSSGSSGSLYAVPANITGDSQGKPFPATTVPVVNYPASSPYHLACGGTTLFAQGNQIEDEVVWNQLSRWMDVNGQASNGGATGGGVSRFSKRPKYQAEARVPEANTCQWVNGIFQNGMAFAGRGVPDVAAVADVQTGYKLFFQGKWGIGGGTGLSAPLWAGLIAQLNEQLGWNVGFINYLLYDLQLRQNAEVLRPIKHGTNGAYVASPTALWNACCGLGTPRGRRLLEELRKIRQSPL